MGRIRDAARGKYLRLGLGELVAAAVFTLIGVFVVAPRMPGGQPALWFALVPLLVVLVQGGAFWILARRWVTLTSMPAGIATVYRAFRILDAILLAIGLGGIVVWWPVPWGAALLVVFVWVFGVVEYVNYFWVRLAYPIDRWLTHVFERRTPRLIRDVRNAEPPSSAVR